MAGERLQPNGERGVVAVANLRQWLMDNSVSPEYARPAVRDIVEFYRYFISPSLVPEPTEVGIIGGITQEMPQISLHLLLPFGVSRQSVDGIRYENVMQPIFYQEVARSLESHLTVSLNLVEQPEIRRVSQSEDIIRTLAVEKGADYIGILDASTEQEGILLPEEEHTRTPEGQWGFEEFIRRIDEHPDVKAFMQALGDMLGGDLSIVEENPENARQIAIMVQTLPIVSPQAQRVLVEEVKKLLPPSQADDPFEPFLQTMREVDPAFDILYQLDKEVGRRTAKILYWQKPVRGLTKTNFQRN